MQLIIVLALLTASLNAVPLNINLGAYSPALVVGDGEISFGGEQDVSNLMNALEGAAVNGATANSVAALAASAAPAVAEPEQPTAAQVQPGADTPQITAIQGIGKEITPRVVHLVKEGVEKRDINGFNAALKFASDALKIAPEVQLGTGEGGSGVGILQEAGIYTPATAKPATAATAPAQARGITARSQMESPKMKTTVTTMFVRGGPALDNDARRVGDGVPAMRKRAPSPGLDGVNLNMAEGQVAELTFVETREVGSDE